MIKKPIAKSGAVAKTKRFPFICNETFCGLATAVAADFFWILFLFLLHIRNFKLKLRPVQVFIRHNARLAASAHHVSQSCDTNANTASDTTQRRN